jgi:Arc/MetJ family transcription regulator
MPCTALDIRSFSPQKRYNELMGKRTSLIVDPVLLEEAAEMLGTKGPTATVREALERIVRQEHLKRLAQWEFPEDALERLEEMRRPRTFDFD